MVLLLDVCPPRHSNTVLSNQPCILRGKMHCASWFVPIPTYKQVNCIGIFMCFPPVFCSTQRVNNWKQFCVACFLSLWERCLQSLTGQITNAGTPLGCSLITECLPGTPEDLALIPNTTHTKQKNTGSWETTDALPLEYKWKEFCIFLFFCPSNRNQVHQQGDVVVCAGTIISSFWGAPVSSEWSLPPSAQVSMTATALSTFWRATLGATSCNTFSWRDLI